MKNGIVYLIMIFLIVKPCLIHSSPSLTIVQSAWATYSFNVEETTPTELDWSDANNIDDFPDGACKFRIGRRNALPVRPQYNEPI